MRRCDGIGSGTLSRHRRDAHEDIAPMTAGCLFAVHRRGSGNGTHCRRTQRTLSTSVVGSSLQCRTRWVPALDLSHEFPDIIPNIGTDVATVTVTGEDSRSICETSCLSGGSIDIAIAGTRRSIKQHQRNRMAVSFILLWLATGKQRTVSVELVPRWGSQ